MNTDRERKRENQNIKISFFIYINPLSTQVSDSTKFNIFIFFFRTFENLRNLYLNVFTSKMFKNTFVVGIINNPAV